MRIHRVKDWFRRVGHCLRIVGSLLLLEAVGLLLMAGIAYGYSEPDVPEFLFSAVVTAVVGAALYFPNLAVRKSVMRNEAYPLIFFSYVILALFATLPFLQTMSLRAFADAFFETVSALTTTGSTVFADVEHLSHAVLMWRSLMQWGGGFGTIVIILTILPKFGMKDMNTLIVSSQVHVSQKLMPRLIEVIRWLFSLYLIVTGIEVATYYGLGMSWFDAVCHAFSTISTGGFSTHNESIAYFHSFAIELAVLGFMFLSGVNFTLLFFVVRGRFRNLFYNEEFRVYLLFILLFSILLAMGLMATEHVPLASVIRVSVFHVVSTMTTSGFFTHDYSTWHPSLWIILFLLMFIGASAGSASGGVKIVRVALMLKSTASEVLHFIHPNAVLPIRFNGRLVRSSVLLGVLVFLLFYVMVIIFSVAILTVLDLSMSEAFGLVLSAIGNVGYNVGTFDEVGFIATLPGAVKYILSFLMLMGRVDIFIVLYLFSRSFWR